MSDHTRYTEVIFRPLQLADQVIYPDHARALAAASCAELDIPPALFNRDDQGATLQGRYGNDRKGEGLGIPPNIVFDGGKGFLRIYGIGSQGADLAEQTAPLLFQGISQKHGLTGVEMKGGECSLAAMERMALYSIRRLVVNKKPGPALKGAASDAACAEIVRRKIVRGLISQARLLGQFEGLIPQDHDIEILEGTSVPIPIKPGILASGFKNIVFAMPAKLAGPWVAGHLRARGYGLIRPVNPIRGGA